MKITVDDKENKIIVGDRSFSINEESYLELFNANGLNNITYQTENIPNFTDSKLFTIKTENLEDNKYINNIFDEEESLMKDFADDLNQVNLVGFNFKLTDIENIIGFNPIFDDRVIKIFNNNKKVINSIQKGIRMHVQN